MRSTKFQNVLSPSSMFVEQAALLGGRREIELDGGSRAGQHDSGSSSLWCVPGLTTSWNIPHEEGPFEDPSNRIEILARFTHELRTVHCG